MQLLSIDYHHILLNADLTAHFAHSQTHTHTPKRYSYASRWHFLRSENRFSLVCVIINAWTQKILDVKFLEGVNCFCGACERLNGWQFCCSFSSLNEFLPSCSSSHSRIFQALFLPLFAFVFPFSQWLNHVKSIQCTTFAPKIDPFHDISIHDMANVTILTGFRLYILYLGVLEWHNLLTKNVIHIHRNCHHPYHLFTHSISY